MKPSEVFYDLALLNGGSFSNINKFCESVTAGYNDNVSSEKEFMNIYRGISNSFSNVTEINSISSKKLCIFADIVKYGNCIEKLSFDEKNIVNDLMNRAKDIITIINNLGLSVDLDEVNLFFVNKYPFPFEKMNAVAIAPDSSDNKKYGIPMGIYFDTNKLSNLQSQLLLAHEIIHIASSRSGTELLARGLEEGLCEFLGSIYCSMKLSNKEVTINYLKFRRLKYNNPSQNGRLYTDYLRMAYLLYLKVGINGLVNIINSGRDAIKRIELLMVNNMIDSIPVSETPTFDKELTDLAGFILLSIPENLVISPLSYYIIKNFDGETEIKQLLENLKIDNLEGRKCLEEIEKRIFGLIVSENAIEYSDIKTIALSDCLKYEL